LKAFLLAAGAGTRLRPLTDHVPKCLVPVCGKPLLAHWLDLLLTQGVDEVLVNTHHLAGQVHEFVASHPRARQVSVLHEERLLGTGGTLTTWPTSTWRPSRAVMRHAPPVWRLRC